MIIPNRQTIGVLIMTQELNIIYKDIPNFEGLYKVSNMGVVVSFKNGKEHFLKGSFNKGYYYVHLCKDGITYHIGVHQLVLRAFVGPQEKGMEVRHLNNNPTDNRLENLCYGTKSENMQDAVASGTLVFSRTNLTVEQVRAIAIDRRAIRTIAKDYGICEATVFSIKQRKSFKNFVDEVYYKPKNKRILTDEEFNFVIDYSNKRKEVMEKINLTFAQVKRIRKTKDRVVLC